MLKFGLAIVIMLGVVPASGFSADIASKSPPNATVYFIEPSDGQTLTKQVAVVFGLKSMGVAPAGVEIENTGHHHLLIDMDTLPNMAEPLPSSDNVRHFGGGQTETVITLDPGKHTLQLLLGNHMHIPHDKPVISEKITIIVK